MIQKKTQIFGWSYPAHLGHTINNLKNRLKKYFDKFFFSFIGFVVVSLTLSLKTPNYILISISICDCIVWVGGDIWSTLGLVINGQKKEGKN